MFKRILIVVVVLIAGFVAFAATRPGSYRVERSAKIDAPAALVFAQLEDLKAWSAWSPWEGKDPLMKKTFEGPAKGVGAGYAWQGNDKVGEGKMTITDSRPPSELKLRLEFIKPFAAVATTELTVQPESAGVSNVTWAMEGTNNLIAKMFGLFMNMDTMIGNDFDKGLAGLKQVAETEARKQEAAAAAAKAAADSAAAAAAEKAKAEAEATAAAAAAAEKAKEAEAKKKGKRKKH
jgi:Polyketide cyclase / dehydrase and lipid transport